MALGAFSREMDPNPSLRNIDVDTAVLVEQTTNHSRRHPRPFKPDLASSMKDPKYLAGFGIHLPGVYHKLGSKFGSPLVLVCGGHFPVALGVLRYSLTPIVPGNGQGDVASVCIGYLLLLPVDGHASGSHRQLQIQRWSQVRAREDVLEVAHVVPGCL